LIGLLGSECDIEDDALLEVSNELLILSLASALLVTTPFFVFLSVSSSSTHNMLRMNASIFLLMACLSLLKVIVNFLEYQHHQLEMMHFCWELFG